MTGLTSVSLAYLCELVCTVLTVHKNRTPLLPYLNEHRIFSSMYGYRRRKPAPKKPPTLKRPASVAAPIEKRAYSVTEFKSAFGVGKTYIFSEIKSGRLKVLRLKGKILITREAADEWLTLMENMYSVNSPSVRKAELSGEAA